MAPCVQVRDARDDEIRIKEIEMAEEHALAESRQITAVEKAEQEMEASTMEKCRIREQVKCFLQSDGVSREDNEGQRALRQCPLAADSWVSCSNADVRSILMTSLFQG